MPVLSDVGIEGSGKSPKCLRSTTFSSCST